MAAAAVIALAAAPAGLGGNGDPIVGGEPASPGEYPAQGALFARDDPISPFQFACGGTLVGSRFFLTAAHCVVDQLGLPMPSSDFLVVLGITDLNTPPSPTTDFNVASVDSNAAFNPVTFQNDTAMLKLDRPAPYAPLRVIGADEASKWSAGTTARIIGWGRTSQGGAGSPNLLEANVPILGDPECSTAYPVEFDANTMVCAYDGIHDTCQGDSGGPLMVPDGAGFVLAGITSWGEGCANANKPGVYTRLGAPALNQWVTARYPRASFAVGPANTGMTTVFTSTSFHPEPDGFTSFAWDFNGDGLYEDGFGATAPSIFATHGPREVGLRASRPGGDTADVRQIVTVNGTPTIEAGGPPNVVPEGGRVVLRATGTDPEGQLVTYAWDLDGNGTFETPGLNPTFSAAGLDGVLVRNVTLQGCDPDGACVRDPGVIEVYNANPRVNAGPNRRVKRRTRVRFRLRWSDPGRDRITVSWRFGDGQRARGIVTSHVYRRPGRYRVRVWVRDDDGGGAVDYVIVRVRR